MYLRSGDRRALARDRHPEDWCRLHRSRTRRRRQRGQQLWLRSESGARRCSACFGNDGFAHELTRSLNARGISTDLLVRSDKVPTFTYTKLINASTGAEDLPRVDFINTQAAARCRGARGARVFARVRAQLRYSFSSPTRPIPAAGGVVTPSVRALLEEISRADPQKIVWVDSRIRIERFRNMILKPNEHEASAASIGLFGEVDYQRLRTHGEFQTCCL